MISLCGILSVLGSAVIAEDVVVPELAWGVPEASLMSRTLRMYLLANILGLQ